MTLAQAVMSFVIITTPGPGADVIRVIPLVAHPSYEACMAAIVKIEKPHGTVFCAPAPKKG